MPKSQIKKRNMESLSPVPRREISRSVFWFKKRTRIARNLHKNLVWRREGEISRREGEILPADQAHCAESLKTFKSSHPRDATASKKNCIY